jgi:DNA-binding FadR family transcriptional regulator
MPANYIASDILRYIIDNNLETGDRLPPLTELSVILNISISKLREQLEVARALNLVAVKPGAGTQVNGFDFAAIMRIGLLYELARSDQYFEAYKSLRNATTAAFWQEAVSLLTADDIAGARELVIAARNKLNGQSIQIPHQEHRAFHLALFKRLNNPFVVGIEEAYWSAYEAVELNHYVDYQYLTTVWDYHERMLDYIEAKDFEQSQMEFVNHTQLLKVNHITFNGN